MEILQHIYNRIWTLDEWLLAVETDRSLHQSKVFETDSYSLKKLLSTTLVAVQEVDVPVFLHNSQAFQQREILLHVVQKLRHRNEKNVLTLGFAMPSDDIGVQVSGTHNIEYQCPNSSFNRLQYPVWSKLLSRIGDSKMEYLLEKTSLFVQVPNSCYVQMTGKPVYELWPMQTGKLLFAKKSANGPSKKKKKKQPHSENQSKRLKVSNVKAVAAPSCKIRNRPIGANQARDQGGLKLISDVDRPSISSSEFTLHTTHEAIIRGKGTKKMTSMVQCTETCSTSRENLCTEPGSTSRENLGFPSTDTCRLLLTNPSTEKEIFYGPNNQNDNLCQSAIIDNDNEQKKGSRKFKKKKNKEKGIEFSPYEYQAVISRIQMLYSKSLREKLSNSFILQSTPATEDGAKVLYRHIFEHNKTIKTSNIKIRWNVSKKESDNKPVDESSCCSCLKSEVGDNVLYGKHSSFFDTQTNDTVFMDIGSEVGHAGELYQGSRQNIIDGNIPNHCLHSLETNKGFEENPSIEQADVSVCMSQGFETSGSEFSEVNSSSDIIDCGKQKQHSLESNFTLLKDPLSSQTTNVLPMGQQTLSTSSHVNSVASETIDDNTNDFKSSTVAFPNCKIQSALRTGKRKRGDSTEDSIVGGKRICLDNQADTASVVKCVTLDPFTIQPNDESSQPNLVEHISQPRAEASLEGNGSCHVVQADDGASLTPNIIPSVIDVPYMKDVFTMLYQMLKKHRKCPYRYLLEYYCPVMYQDKSKHHVLLRGRKQYVDINLLGTFSVRENLHKIIPHRQVYLFLRRVCLNIIPEDLFGDRNNRNIFCKNIKKIISLNKYDKICVGQLMTGIKVKCIKWLRCVKSNSLKLHVMAVLLYWMVTELVIPMIKTFFYVTDTTQHVNCLFYYRKISWHKLHHHAVSDLVKRNILKRVTERKVKKLIKDRQSLGVSSIRFLPKPKGLRPIVNLGSQQKDFQSRSLSINKQLLNLLQVLSLIKRDHPEVVGAAKFGIDEVYQTWKEFAVKQSQPLYFVKTDIKHCYDEILQHKLFSIVKRILTNPDVVSDDFIIRRYVKIVNEGGIIKRRFLRRAFLLSDYKPDFISFITHRAMEDQSHNAIFVDQVVSQQETRTQLLKLLHCHIFHNIIRIGQTYYEQSKGISQGSVISTLLCNIYYGDMEKLFPVETGELMMRIVDDALFVTPSKDRAVQYCLQMMNGVPEYNLSINKNKVVTNVDVPEFGTGIHVMQENDWLPWCGILLNMKTLEASVNLSFYFSCSLQHSMTFDCTSRAGDTMKRKLFRSMRLKCHPFYFDSKLNSMNIIVINVYKILLLSASKFMEYVRHLPKKDNLQFLKDIIFALGSYFDLLYRKTIKKCGQSCNSLSSSHIHWLCYHAFTLKLKQRLSQFKPVTSSLERCKAKLNSKLKHVKNGTDFLLAVCGNSLPEEFTRIK